MALSSVLRQLKAPGKTQESIAGLQTTLGDLPEESLGWLGRGLGLPSVFSQPEFTEPTFEPRQFKALDIGNLLAQTRQHKAITGRGLSPSFIRGITEPVLKTGAKYATTFQSLEDVRKREERGLAWGEYEFERRLAFDEFRHAEEMKMQRKSIESQDSGWCIIVTACHGKESKEVNLTREYRDKFLDKDTLRGYYMIADKLVPIMKINELYKKYIKKNFVNHFINAGKYWLGKTSIKPNKAILITKEFLNICKVKGKSIKSYARLNGEVF